MMYVDLDDAVFTPAKFTGTGYYRGSYVVNMNLLSPRQVMWEVAWQQTALWLAGVQQTYGIPSLQETVDRVVQRIRETARPGMTEEAIQGRAAMLREVAWGLQRLRTAYLN